MDYTDTLKLSREQQRNEYFKMLRGSSDSRDKLIRSCIPLAKKIAMSFASNNAHISASDFEGEAYISLIKAVDNWDVDRGSLSNIVTTTVTNDLIRIAHKSDYDVRRPFTVSHRAGEDLYRLHKADIDLPTEQLCDKTGLKKTRVEFLKRASLGRVPFENVDRPNDEEDNNHQPCQADLQELMKDTLSTDQYNFFAMASGLTTGYRMSSQEISLETGVDKDTVRAIILASKRKLVKAVREK